MHHPRDHHQDADLLASFRAAVAASGAKVHRHRPGLIRCRAHVAQDGDNRVALLHDVNALCRRVAAGDLVLGLRQQGDVFRHDAGLESGIGIGNGAFGGIGELEIGLHAAGVGCGVGKRSIAKRRPSRASWRQSRTRIKTSTSATTAASFALGSTSRGPWLRKILRRRVRWPRDCFGSSEAACFVVPTSVTCAAR